MLRLTHQAIEVIQSHVVSRGRRDRVGMRLTKNADGQLALILAPARPGDAVAPSAELPVLVVDGEIASELRGCLLDVRSPGDPESPRFVLRSPLVDP